MVRIFILVHPLTGMDLAFGLKTINDQRLYTWLGQGVRE